MKNKIHNLLFESERIKVPLKKILEMSFSKNLPVKVEKNKGDTYWNDTIPFYYGEYPNYINPADNMGWDVIIISDDQNFDNLTCHGVVPIYEHANLIEPPHGNKPGNHKLIISNHVLTKEEKTLINEFFKNKPAFLKPVYFDEKPIVSFLKEEWEKSLLGKYKLGHVHHGDFQGIAVGPTARKYFGASKMK